MEENINEHHQYNLVYKAEILSLLGHDIQLPYRKIDQKKLKSFYYFYFNILNKKNFYSYRMQSPITNLTGLDF